MSGRFACYSAIPKEPAYEAAMTAFTRLPGNRLQGMRHWTAEYAPLLMLLRGIGSLHVFPRDEIDDYNRKAG